MRGLREEAGQEVNALLQKKFVEYYRRAKPPLPLDYAQREYGFGFETKIDYRHKAFKSRRDFDAFFEAQAPLYASHSCAVYRTPDARPMERKGWEGADLVFDFDAPRLDAGHYESREHNALLCPRCLETVLADSRQLMEEFLFADFGFSKKETILVYSGNKGYHVHVRSNALRELRQDERRELLEFVNGPKKDLLVRSKDERHAVLRGPTAESKGWHKKFYCEAEAALADPKAAGFSKPKTAKIEADRKWATAALAKGNWGFLPDLEKVWERVWLETKRKHALNPDAQVTLDLARLIRLPGSLHGGTGFAAAIVDRPDFDPLKHALAFSMKRTEAVRTSDAFIVELGGEARTVKAGENEVPEAVAVLLAAKGKLA